MQFRREEAEGNCQHELQMAKMFASALHTQNPPSGPFSRELYGINYQNVSPTSPPIVNSLHFPLSYHTNRYATLIHYTSQSYNFQDTSSSRYMNADRNDKR